MSGKNPDIRKARYATPTCSDMAVVMVMFNACDSARIVQNWLFVWNRLVSAGIPVFGVELLYPWQKPALSDAVKTLTVRSDSVMFHKEKLVERLMREVPASYTKICYMDCDVVFHRPDWYDAVSAALDKIAVVQPFSRCYWLGPDLRTSLITRNSAAAEIDQIRSAHATGGSDRLSGNPGFAMAMQRSVQHFPWAIVGGGDAVFFRGVNGLVGEFANPRMSKLMAESWTTWTATSGVGTAGCIEGDISHLWHGPVSGRQYYDRYAQFIKAVPASVSDIRELLVENTDGVWSWKPEYKSALNKMMLHYFAGRDDDSMVIG
jgi:hypothetical protein